MCNFRGKKQEAKKQRYFFLPLIGDPYGNRIKAFAFCAGLFIS